jgi:speckle-type POZ protein
LTLSPPVEPEEDEMPSISEDIEEMYQDETFADFSLTCSDGEVLKCHKFMLAARSPVFRTMLSIDMKEAKEGFVEVPDFGSVVMKEVLRFIYCDEVEDIVDIASSLIFAAEKYELEKLKKICIESMIENLSKENVIECLLITEKIPRCEKLYEECVDVILR